MSTFLTKIFTPFVVLLSVFSPHRSVAPQVTPLPSHQLDIYHVEEKINELDYRTTQLEDNKNLGASNPVPTSVAFFETSLQNKITSSATSMILVSATDKTGTTLASSTYAFVIDEGSATEEMVVADCTGITCTNMVRGLSPITGTTSVSALQFPHGRGASVKITDGPQLLILSRILSGVGTIPNILYYSSAPNFAGVSNSAVASLKYVNDTAIAGAPIASNSTLGIVRLATALQLASSTDDFEEPLVPHSSYSTSSPGTLCGLCLPITQNNGKLSPSFTDFTANNTYSGRNMYIASTSFVSTTTISALNVKSNALIINNIPYKMPVTQGAAGSLLTNDGTGVNTWVANTPVRYVWANTSPGFSLSNNTTSTTTDGLFIPGGTLNASSTIEVKIGTGNSCASSGSGSGTIFLRTSTGLPIWSGGLTSDSSSVTSRGQNHDVTIVASNNSSTFASQAYIDSTMTSITTGAGEAVTIGVNIGSAAIDFSQDQTLKLILTNQSCDSQVVTVGGFVVTASR